MCFARIDRKGATMNGLTTLPRDTPRYMACRKMPLRVFPPMEKVWDIKSEQQMLGTAR